MSDKLTDADMIVWLDRDIAGSYLLHEATTLAEDESVIIDNIKVAKAIRDRLTSYAELRKHADAMRDDLHTEWHRYQRPKSAVAYDKWRADHAE